MEKVNLQRDFVMTTATGVTIAIADKGMTIIVPLPLPAVYVTITGADYDRLKAEIARHVNPALIMGKPIQGIDGDIYIGIRKRQEGL